MNEFTNVQKNEDIVKPSFTTTLEKFINTENNGSPYSDRIKKDFTRAIMAFEKYQTESHQVQQHVKPQNQIVEKQTSDSMNMMSITAPVRTGLEMIDGKYIYKVNMSQYQAQKPSKDYYDFDDIEFDIASHIESGKNLLLEGHSGIGKTQKVHEECAKRKIKLVTLMCNEGTKLSDLKGHRELEGDLTPYMLGVLPTAIEIANQDGVCVLYIDELGLLTAQIQGLLNETLDFRRAVTIESLGKTYQLNPEAKLIVIATTNPSTYGGRNPINADLNSRFDVRVMRNPTVDETEKIVDWTNIPSNLKKGLLGMYEQLVSASLSKELDYTLSPRDIDTMVEQLKINFKVTGEPVTEDDSMFDTKAFKSVVKYIYAKYRSEPDSHKETVKKIIQSCTNIIV